MTLDTLTTTVMLFSIAAILGAFYFLINEIDQILRQIRRPVLARGHVLTTRAVRVNGRVWDLPSHQDKRVRRGKFVYLVMEA